MKRLSLSALVLLLALAIAGEAEQSKRKAPSRSAARPASAAPTRVDTVPIPPVPYPPARPMPVVKEVFEFAAQHPEVLSYVPCYCGCERSGHRHNDDCFVRSRDTKGNVADWEMHGYT